MKIKVIEIFHSRRARGCFMCGQIIAKGAPYGSLKTFRKSIIERYDLCERCRKAVGLLRPEAIAGADDLDELFELATQKERIEEEESAADAAFDRWNERDCTFTYEGD